MASKKKVILNPLILSCPYCKHKQATRKKIGFPICCSMCKKYYTVRGKR